MGFLSCARYPLGLVQIQNPPENPRFCISKPVPPSSSDMGVPRTHFEGVAAEEEKVVFLFTKMLGEWNSGALQSWGKALGVQGAPCGFWVKRLQLGVGWGRTGTGGKHCSQGSQGQRRGDGVDPQDGGRVCFAEPGGRGWKALASGERKSWGSWRGTSIFSVKEQLRLPAENRLGFRRPEEV